MPNPTAQQGHALITGASSGIGAAIARAYAQRGVPLILTARRLDRLQQLAEELAPRVPVQVIAADLADAHAPQRLVEEIATRGVQVRVLVNNAGYGVPGRYRQRDWATHATFLQVMVTAVCELTWRLLPQIRADGQGGILNVASFAGLVPAADGQTLYAPAKRFLVALSEGLSLENADAGVRVTALCPGFTYSEFHDVTGTRSRMAALPRWLWLDAEAVAEAGVRGLERGRVLMVPGLPYRLLHAAARHLPHGLVLRRMGRSSARIRPLE